MLKYIENSVGIHRCTCMVDIYIIIFWKMPCMLFNCNPDKFLPFNDVHVRGVIKKFVDCLYKIKTP